MENTLRIDKNNFVRFKWDMEKAHQNNRKTFTFNGQEVVTKFAKYVIEKVENKFAS